ncbi:hypothetical protein PBV87_08050 [Niameybacter massiliensis]|uniref:Uncharacterized protein n=1 Tax=Holtiella tumoricola TaxID=3018743 RepID=A0AA42DM97_9FIRM|nr:hypothetical protein [Holtiella tumoricola]MDA3731427.1 hypothetical protein [Holtiella tumoricola]
MKHCKVCDCEFIPASNRQKYCAECKKQVLQEQRKKALIKYYKKLDN